MDAFEKWVWEPGCWVENMIGKEPLHHNVTFASIERWLCMLQLLSIAGVPWVSWIHQVKCTLQGSIFLVFF